MIQSLAGDGTAIGNDLATSSTTSIQILPDKIAFPPDLADARFDLSPRNVTATSSTPTLTPLSHFDPPPARFEAGFDFSPVESPAGGGYHVQQTATFSIPMGSVEPVLDPVFGNARTAAIGTGAGGANVERGESPNGAFTDRATGKKSPTAVPNAANPPAIAERGPSGTSYSVDHDTVLSVSTDQGVLSDMYGPNGGTLSAQEYSTPAHGTLNFDTDGSFVYTPDNAFVDTDTFEFELFEDNNSLEVISVDLNVINHAPFTYDQSYTVVHDTVLTGQLDARDDETDSHTFQVSQNPAHGSVQFDEDTGDFTYTPQTHYKGPDTFQYKATDGLALGDAATVSIDVTNNKPLAGPDAYSVTHDHTLTVTAYTPGVLANDQDYDSDSLTVHVTAQPSNGSLSFNSDGTFTYTPNTHFVGEDTFWYKANDGVEDGDAMPVTVSVTNYNPVATTAYVGYSPIVLNSLAATASDADGDTLTYSLVSGPSHGSVSFNSDGTFGYTPSAPPAQFDTLTFNVSDGLVTSNTATILLALQLEEFALSGTPFAYGNAYTMVHDCELDGFGGYAYTVDPEQLTPPNPRDVLDSGPSHGTLTLHANGTFEYTPDAGFLGTDSFTYHGEVDTDNGTLTGNTAPVYITVTNVVPVGRADAFVMSQFGTLSETIASNDDDADNDTLTASLISGPYVGDGSFTLNANGSFVYTPPVDFVGLTGFKYRESDGVGQSTIIQARIFVLPALTLGNMMIHNGLEARAGGGMVKGEEKVKTGAVTVANLNDTDNDGIIDKDDPNISVNPPNANGGTNEVDMMLLFLYQPKVLLGNPFPQGTNFRAHVDAGSAVIWKRYVADGNADKAQSKLGGRAPENYTVADWTGPFDVVQLYVEATDVSTLQGIKVNYEYKLPNRNVWLKLDTVSATGVWVTNTNTWKTRATGTPATLVDTDLKKTIDKDKSATDNSTVGYEMFRPETPPGGGAKVDSYFGGRILFEFSVAPLGAEKLAVFDVTRRAQIFAKFNYPGAGPMGWQTPPLDGGGDRTQFPALAEVVNDDNGTEDEQNDPSGAAAGKLYSYDSPSTPVAALIAYAKKDGSTVPAFVIYRANFVEFVRMKVRIGDKVTFAHPGGAQEIQGSRVTDTIKWHEAHHLKWDGTKLVLDTTALTANTPKFSGAGNGTIAVTPVGTFPNATVGVEVKFNNGTWTATSTLGVNGQLAAQSGTITLTPAGNAYTITIVITAGNVAFANNDEFDFTVYQTKSQGGKTNEINTGSHIQDITTY